jgi:ethanolamine-phosphate cytidylyltransferase
MTSLAGALERSPSTNITIPTSQFLATTRRIMHFSNNREPKASDKVVYISGSFDLLHNGHIETLKQAKAQGDFLFVGVWSDDVVNYFKGSNYPILSLHERVLMVLACKYVDDVVVGAPY